MARSATPTRNGRPGASGAGVGPSLRVIAASPGTRGDSERVSQVVPDALAPWLEVIAIADDVIAAAERIAMAAAAGSRAAVLNEANRLAYRVTGCRREARERITAIEPVPAA